MRILFLTTRLTGGAGIAARRLWEGMQTLPEPEMLTIIYREKADLVAKSWSKITNRVEDAILYKHSSDWPNERSSAWLEKNRSPFTDTYISALEEKLPYDEIITQSCIDADLINIHWTAGLLSATAWNHIARISRPVLVNLHDYNYITGGCHYPAGCTLYEVSCTSCPQVSSIEAKALVLGQHELKHHLLNNSSIYWTAPSAWLSSILHNASLISDNTRILPPHRNIIGFKEPNKEVVAKKDRIQSGNQITIGLVADNLGDTRKGIYIAAKAAAKAVALLPSGCIASLHIIGGESEQLRNYIENITANTTRFEATRLYGWLNPSKMQEVLESLDILLFPSLEENYSNLVIETISAGTACIAFAVGGNTEIANEYPAMMRVVGSNLNISNGINECQADVIDALSNLMATEIAKIDFQESDQARESAKCREDHSVQKLAPYYAQTFGTLIKNYRIMQQCAVPAGASSTTLKSQYAQAYLPESGEYSYSADEPVAWVEIDSIVKRSAEKHSSGKVFVYCLTPSWDSQYVRDRLSSETAWLEYKLVTHSSAHIEQLEYWDLHLLIFNIGHNDCSFSEQEFAQDDIRLPVLCAWVSQEPDENLGKNQSVDELILECILNNCIIRPMKGLNAYKQCYLGDTSIKVTDTTFLRDGDPLKIRKPPYGESLLSTRVATYTSNDGPVLWLPQNLTIDIKIADEEFLVLAIHIPSWENDYLAKRLSNPQTWLPLFRIPHFKADIDALKYWDTVICQVRGADLQPTVFQMVSDGNIQTTLATSFIGISKSSSPEEVIDYVRESVNIQSQGQRDMVFKAGNTLQSLFIRLDSNGTPRG